MRRIMRRGKLCLEHCLGMGAHLLKGHLMDHNCTATLGDPSPNQTNTPCNNKNPNIGIHIHYPIATMFGDGTSLVKGNLVDHNCTATLGDHKPNQTKPTHNATPRPQHTIIPTPPQLQTLFGIKT